MSLPVAYDFGGVRFTLVCLHADGKWVNLLPWARGSDTCDEWIVAGFDAGDEVYWNGQKWGDEPTSFHTEQLHTEVPKAVAAKTKTMK